MKDHAVYEITGQNRGRGRGQRRLLPTEIQREGWAFDRPVQSRRGNPCRALWQREDGGGELFVGAEPNQILRGVHGRGMRACDRADRTQSFIPSLFRSPAFNSACYSYISAAISSSSAAISLNSRFRSSVLQWNSCPSSLHVSRIWRSFSVWAYSSMPDTSSSFSYAA